MKQINEFFNRNRNKAIKIEKETTETIEPKLTKALIDYAKFYEYDANELMAAVIWKIYSDCCITHEPEYAGMNPEAVKKNWEEEYYKAMDVCG